MLLVSRRPRDRAVVHARLRRLSLRKQQSFVSDDFGHLNAMATLAGRSAAT
jgi:hypothetical protein